MRSRVGFERPQAQGLDALLVHAGGVVVADLPVGGRRTPALSRMSRSAAWLRSGELVEPSPARAVGGNGVAGQPAAAGELVEVGAGVHRPVEGVDVEAGHAPRAGLVHRIGAAGGAVACAAHGPGAPTIASQDEGGHGRSFIIIGASSATRIAPEDYPRAARVGHVGQRPLEHHHHAVAEADQEEDVDADPGQPRGEAREPQAADLRHRGLAADGGQRPLVAVLEPAPRLRLQRPEDVAGDVPAHLHGRRRHARARACRRVTAARSPATKTSGWPGTVRSGSTLTRPARSHSPSIRPSGDVDLAFMLHRLILNDHEVPERVRSFAQHLWQRGSVQRYVQHQRPPYVAY